MKLDQVMIIKVGGALLTEPPAMSQLMQTIHALHQQGQAIVLVHGGGCLIEQQLAANGLASQKYQGLRITPSTHMPIIAGALAGTANKQLQACAKQQGLLSIGLSLADADLVQAEIADPHLGCVGQVQPNNPDYLVGLLNQGYLPIVSSIGVSELGQLLNINADQAAVALAQLLQTQLADPTQVKLILLSDVSGVLDLEKQLLPQLNSKQIKQLIAKQVIHSGMKIKVESALQVATQLNTSVTIASWADPKQLQAFAQGQAFGTEIRV